MEPNTSEKKNSRHSLYHENQVLSVLILLFLIEIAQINLTNLTLKEKPQFHTYLLSPQAECMHLKEKDILGSPTSCLDSTLYRTVSAQAINSENNFECKLNKLES